MTSKMNFYSVHFNRPDFISIQKFCIDKIGGNLIVIDNSYHGDYIKKECEKLGVTYYKNPNNKNYLGDPSFSHGSALNFTKTIIDYTFDWCLIDHDFFPLYEIGFENFDLLSIPQVKKTVTYLWPGLLAGKRDIILDDVDFFPIHGIGDTGVGTRIFVEDNQHKIKWVSQKPMSENIPKGTHLQKMPVLNIVEGVGIHYLNGSSWMPVENSVVEIKNHDLLETIKKIH